MSGENVALAVKLIEPFEGEGDVIRWLNNVDLVCELQNVKDIAKVLPLRLRGGAAAAYDEMPAAKKKNIDDIRQALMKAFALAPLEAWERFEARKMLRGETPDRYLNTLRGLARRFGGVPEEVMLVKFISGLPDPAQQTLRTHDEVLTMTVETALARARACLVGTNKAANAVAVACEVDGGQEVMEYGSDVYAASAAVGGRGRGAGARGRECYACGGSNHLAKHCFTRSKEGRKCFKCHKLGHIAAQCPEGNQQGEQQPQAGNE